jgi:hypothetical protein
LDCIDHFVQVIITQFGDEYLRFPNERDVQRYVSYNEARGFPGTPTFAFFIISMSGCFGSIDCNHWNWKLCPTAWAGQVSFLFFEFQIFFSYLVQRSRWKLLGDDGSDCNL